jgi:phage portal protein BeeE
VSGDGLKFEPFTIPADQAQLVEQLGWTVEDVARAYLVPLYKISAQKDVKVDPAMRQEYYDTVLHPYMNAIESLQAEGLRLPSKIWALFDVDELLRLDPVARYNKLETGIKAGILSPNEARLSENYSNVVGGESPYLQQQNYSLAALAKRDAQADPVGAPVSEDVTEEMATFVLRRIEEGLRCVT